MAMKRRNLLLGSGGTLLLSLFPWEIAYGAGIVDVRIWPADEYTRITIEHDGKLLAQNGYHDVFYMPQHTPGHPTYMSHETGCRIYWA